jgi:hypothetical protein
MIRLNHNLRRDLPIIKYIRDRKLYRQQLACFLLDTDSEFEDLLLYTEIG